MHSRPFRGRCARACCTDSDSVFPDDLSAELDSPVASPLSICSSFRRKPESSSFALFLLLKCRASTRLRATRNSSCSKCRASTRLRRVRSQFARHSGGTGIQRFCSCPLKFRASPCRRASVLLTPDQVQSFDSPAASRLLFGMTPGILPSALRVSSAVRAAPAAQCPKSRQKRPGAGRGICGAPAPQIPCASRRDGVAQTVRPCSAEQSRRSIAATLRAFSRRACDARHRERRRLFHRIRPSMDYVGVVGWESASRLCFGSSLLRQDAAETGPLWRGERAQEKPEGARAGCARVRCMHTDVHSANPGARSRTRSTGICGERATGGVFLW